MSCFHAVSTREARIDLPIEAAHVRAHGHCAGRAGAGRADAANATCVLAPTEAALKVE